MCGEKIFVCPVFDEGVREAEISLPQSEKGFRLRGQGELLPGKTCLKATCGIDDLPLYFVEEE